MTDSEKQPGYFEKLGRRIDESLVAVPRFVLGRIERFSNWVLNLPPNGKMHLVVFLGAAITVAGITYNKEDLPTSQMVATVGTFSTIVVAGVTRVIAGIRRR